MPGPAKSVLPGSYSNILINLELTPTDRYSSELRQKRATPQLGYGAENVTEGTDE
jgi:hypothetical protein